MINFDLPCGNHYGDSDCIGCNNTQCPEWDTWNGESKVFKESFFKLRIQKTDDSCEEYQVKSWEIKGNLLILKLENSTKAINIMQIKDFVTLEGGN